MHFQTRLRGIISVSSSGRQQDLAMVTFLPRGTAEREEWAVDRRLYITVKTSLSSAGVSGFGRDVKDRKSVV